ncbi:MAG TPA: hypothetical protein PLF81_31915 [Candidatus Anammoximicrobium sp.]|nr:hypothetical protein [Candidatus Anammoximicrobium sp.]
MITISRSLARQLRAVFRRAGIGKSVAGGYGQRALFLAGGDTLRIRGSSNNAAVEYQVAHQAGAVEALVPMDLFAACEGSRPDPVQLDFTLTDKVTASWIDKRVPVVRDFATSTPDDTLPPFPPSPETYASNDLEFWAALREAAATTDQQPHRFALSCVQLCGANGKVVATDGQQALVQSGFAFPWTDDLLVPASDVVGYRDLTADQPIQVGKTEDWVTFKTGPWTISLKVEKDARFPDVSRHVGDPAAAASHLRIADSDSDFLNDALPRLPCDDNVNCPVTLDLNGQVLIRGKAADQSRATELILSNSRLEGDALTVNSNREYLLRALRLGFRDVHFCGREQPVLCDDGRRQLVWALLSPDSPIPSSPDLIRIASIQRQADDTSGHPQPKRSKTTVSEPVAQSPPTGEKPVTKAKRSSVSKRPSPIEQAIAFRDALRAAVAQANGLIRSLKQQRREARLVQTTLASLKQLQKVGV